MLFDLERNEDAIKYFDIAIKLDFQDSLSYLYKGITFIILGIALSKLEKYKEAINCYDEGIHLDSTNPELHINKGCKSISKYTRICIRKFIKVEASYLML